MDSRPDIEIFDSHVIFHGGAGPVEEARRAAGLPPEKVAPAVPMSPADRDLVAIEMATHAMASVGVHGGLWYGDLDNCVLAVSHYPDLFRAVTYVSDPRAGSVDDVLRTARSHREIVGIRVTPSWPPTGENMRLLYVGAFDRWFSAAESADMFVSVYLYGDDLAALPAIARRYPGLRILVDHLGSPPVPLVRLTPDRLSGVPQLLRLASYENVAVKYSSAPSLSYESYPFGDVRPVLGQLVDAFGPHRVMWGSDFRRLRTVCSYEEIVSAVRDDATLSPHERGLVLGGALRHFLGWDSPRPSAD